MSINKTGEVSWSDTQFNSEERKNSKDLFLRLSPGSNVVRLLTNPYLYYQHKYKIEGEKGYGHRINCSAPGDSGACPVCAKGDKPKRRWLLGVIDRKTNAYKVLDIGWSVFKSISTFAKDDDWSNPINYDIDIVVDINGGATGYYTVCPKPKKPLSASDLQLKEDVDVADLVRRSSPPTSEQAEIRFQSIMDEFAPQTSTSNGKAPLAAPVALAAEEADEDADFTDYDATKRAPF